MAVNTLGINSTLSHSQKIEHKEELVTKGEQKTLEQLVPQHLLKFREVFLQGKQMRKTLPMSRPFDHEIKLKEGFVPKNCKIYPLNPQETERMKLFIKENLASGFIQRSKSPQASPFFVGKKEIGELQPCQDY